VVARSRVFGIWSNDYFIAIIKLIKDEISIQASVVKGTWISIGRY